MNDMKPLPLDPPYDWPGYGSTRLRFPREPLVALPADAFDRTGPLVPAGFVQGLPCGLSLVGPAWSEARLIALAYAFEQASPQRRPPAFPKTISPRP